MLCEMKTLFLLVGFTAGLSAGGWQAGAVAVDVTPSEPIWLAGYAARTRPSESVRMPIHA